MTREEKLAHARRAARETSLRLDLPPPTPKQIETVRMYLARSPLPARQRAAA